MGKYYPLVLALLIVGGNVQAQKKEHQKTARTVITGTPKTGQPVGPAPVAIKSNQLSDSTLAAIQEQLRSRNLSRTKMDLSLMTEPRRPIL